MTLDTNQERIKSQHVPFALRLLASVETPQQIPRSSGSAVILNEAIIKSGDHHKVFGDTPEAA